MLLRDRKVGWSHLLFWKGWCDTLGINKRRLRTDLAQFFLVRHVRVQSRSFQLRQSILWTSKLIWREGKNYGDDRCVWCQNCDNQIPIWLVEPRWKHSSWITKRPPVPVAVPDARKDFRNVRRHYHGCEAPRRRIATSRNDQENANSYRRGEWMVFPTQKLARQVGNVLLCGYNQHPTWKYLSWSPHCLPRFPW